MSGVTIIGALIEADPPLITRVPIDRIKAGRLPDGVVLPAFLIRSVSIVEQQFLRRGTIVRTTERVAVTVRTSAYRDIDQLLRMCRTACAGFVGSVADFDRVSVLSAGTGPDLNGPADSFERTQDFRVTFDAPA